MRTNSDAAQPAASHVAMTTLELSSPPPSVVRDLGPRPATVARAQQDDSRPLAINPTRISFGGTAAIVTSMALITGLDAADASRATVIGALLIAAIADNLTDSLSVHMYQESERLEQRQAFQGTLANFITRLVVCLTFVLAVALLGRHAAAVWGVAWGMALLSGLSYLLARHRGVGAVSEIAKHLVTAVLVILVSKGVGHWIAVHLH